MPKRVSFVDKYIKSGAIPIHLVRCKDTSGRECFHFLMCSNEKIKALKQVIDGTFDLKEYGKVIASGFGHTPSESIKKMLKDEYNFDATEVI
jgi:hypothetical protein